tara:strand:+ start:117 stop:362 length:246 start_codon:yes stop_codon:yes gene_type:complete
MTTGTREKKDKGTSTVNNTVTGESTKVQNSQMENTYVDKQFKDYQQEGNLKGTMFDYVPDPGQIGQYLLGKLNRIPNKKKK